MLTLVPVCAPSQDFQPPPAGVDIVAISFEPEPQTRSLLDLLEIRVGDSYSASAMRNSIRNIMRLGTYSNVTVEWSHVGDGIALIFELEQIPTIEGITITGNGPISKRRITELTGLSTDDRYDETRAQRLIQTITNLYREEGYYAASVDIYSMVNLESGGVRLEITIMPGQGTTLEDIRVIGYPILAVDEIIAAMPRTARNAIFSEAVFRSEVKYIQELYQRQGYLAADISIANIVYQAESNVVFVNMIINAGPVIRTEFSPPLKDQDYWLSLIPFGDRNIPVDQILNNGQARIVEGLRRRGHANANAEIDFEIIPEEGAIQVYTSIDKGDVYTVDALRIEGIDSDLTERMVPQLGLSKKSWFSRPRFSRVILDEDVARIRQFLVDEGYTQAELSVDESEPDGDQAKMEILIRIDPGPRSVISSIAFIGNRSYDTPELLAVLGLKVGQVLTSNSVNRALDNLRNWYDDEGFPDSRIVARARGSGSVELVFDITEGDGSIIQKIIITGNYLTRESVIRRNLTVREGDPYSLRRIAESQRALNSMGIFDRVEISAVEDELNRRDKRIVVDVIESRPYSLIYGLGVDSEEKLRFNFGFSNSNITGRNIEAGFSTRLSQLEQRYQIFLRSPRLFRGLVDNTLRLVYEEFERPGYRQRVKGLIFESTGFRWRGWSITGLLQYRWVDVVDLVPLVEVSRLDKPIRLASISAVISRDLRNDLIEPTSGSLTNLIFDLSLTPLGSDLSYAKGETQYYSYSRVFGSVVVARALRIGVALPFSGGELIPISERFFLGGGNSLRGFSLDEVGPSYIGLDGREYPMGGNAMINGNLELRFPLYGMIGGATFYGFGNVFPLAEDFEFSDIEHAVGLGFRLGTPFGPLRLDYGISLTTDDDQFYFTFGHAF